MGPATPGAPRRLPGPELENASRGGQRRGAGREPPGGAAPREPAAARAVKLSGWRSVSRGICHVAEKV